jgi:hypothetical protein
MHADLKDVKSRLQTSPYHLAVNESIQPRSGPVASYGCPQNLACQIAEAQRHAGTDHPSA